MAFLGSIGRFFSQGPGAIVFPPVAIGLNLIQAARSGEGLKGFIRREAAIYGLKPSSSAAEHGQPGATTRIELVQSGGFGFAGPQSSGSFADVGGPPWQTDLTPSGPISGWSRAAMLSAAMSQGFSEEWGSPTFWEGLDH